MWLVEGQIPACMADCPNALGRMLSDRDADKSMRVMNAMVQKDKLDLKCLQQAVRRGVIRLGAAGGGDYRRFGLRAAALRLVFAVFALSAVLRFAVVRGLSAFAASASDRLYAS